MEVCFTNFMPYTRAMNRLPNSLYDVEAVPRIASLARAISDLIRCTTLVPVLNSRAVLRTPLPLASAARIAASVVASILARPIGFPLLVPFSRALASPAWIRSWMIVRSNSANTPSIWKSARPAGVVVSDRLLFEIEIASGGVEFAQKADEVLQ